MRATLICTKTLAEICEKLKISDFIYMSFGEEKNDGRHNQKILEDIMESVIGALYLDGGFDIVKNFISLHWENLIKQQNMKEIKPYKSRLQEWVQKQIKERPVYSYKSIGTMKEPLFETKCEINIKNISPIAVQTRNKRDGEKEVAKNMIEYIENNIDKNI
jgi:ribonuclease-3